MTALDLALATPADLAAAYGARYRRLPPGATSYPRYIWDPRTERLVAAGPAPALRPRPLCARPRTDPRRVAWVAPANPKRPGTAAHARFALWYAAPTVAAFLAAGGRVDDVRHDEAAGHVRLVLP